MAVISGNLYVRKSIGCKNIVHMFCQHQNTFPWCQ